MKRRSYRRNPGFLSQVQRGLVDAAWVTGGKVAYNLTNRALPFTLPLPGIAGDLVKGIGVALIGSWATGMFLRGDAQRMAIAGMYQGVVEGAARALGVPFVSTALGEYDSMGAYPRSVLGSYPTAPQLPGVGVGAYPTIEDEVAMSEQQYG